MEIIENLCSKIFEFIFQNGLFVAIWLLLAIVALWLQARFMSRIGIKLQRMSIPEIKQPSHSQLDDAPVIIAPPPIEIEADANEVDSILEEAELYADHGRPATAVKILQEIIKTHPSKAAAWSLLLSSYSSLGKALEFEEVAGEFLKHHKGSPLWSSVQALGRTFDPNNPLYADKNGSSCTPITLSNAANSRRPVGDILIRMGVLNEQTVQRHLDTFDPKKHGRFGGYLLAHKEITLAQLNQALLLQQGGLDEVKSPKSSYSLAVPACDGSSQLRSVYSC